MESFQFQFNIEFARQLRDAVNDRQKQSIDTIHNERQIGGDYYAWNRICAIMDRLEDTLYYLNQIEIGKDKNTRSAFDFYDFINNAFIVIDCIKTIGKIFRVDDALITEIEKSSSVFGNRLGEKSCDQYYFEYIRSLCSVHPLCTNRHKEFLGGSKFHCCPFVSWDRSLTWIDGQDADLVAFVYPSDRQGKSIYIGLYVSQFERYLKKWIDFIPKIIEAKNNYADKEYERLKKTPVKNLSDFDGNVALWLMYLKDEYCKRFDYGSDYVFDEYFRLFTIRLSDFQNNVALEKYRNAVEYSLHFLRNELQNMTYEGYENNGIRHPETWLETTLFDSLSLISTNGSDFSAYGYNLQKIYYLDKNYPYSEYDKHFARRLLEAPKGLINHYVHFTNSEPDEERIVLVQLALYLDALSRKTFLNKNIPNTSEYRLSVLSDEEYKDLFLEEPSDDCPLAKEDLLDLLKEYGG